MTFEEWFKENTNECVNENTNFSYTFVQDAWNAARDELRKEQLQEQYKDKLLYHPLFSEGHTRGISVS